MEQQQEEVLKRDDHEKRAAAVKEIFDNLFIGERRTIRTVNINSWKNYFYKHQKLTCPEKLFTFRRVKEEEGAYKIWRVK